MKKGVKVTFLIPCLDEEETLGFVIDEIYDSFRDVSYEFEVLVSDNDSKDYSRELAASKGAKVIRVKEKGYGSVLKAGIESANGKFIVMGDADGSYHFSDSKIMIEMLEQGFDLIMGDRFRGSIEKGAMPWLHRYLGNPVLSFLGRVFFKTKVRDFHCGLRAFRKDKIQGLKLKSNGMEYASELVILSSLKDLVIGQTKVNLHKDLRSRPPHLKTWRDGYRHLKLLLAYKPTWIFMPFISLLVLLILIILFIALEGNLKVAQVELTLRTIMTLSIASILVLLMIYSIRVIQVITQIKLDIPNVKNNNFMSILIFSSLSAVGVISLVSEFWKWRNAQFAQFFELEGLIKYTIGLLMVLLGFIGGIFTIIIRIIRKII
jgi:glycosyltransferase involved in cell wall biosynthesis